LSLFSPNVYPKPLFWNPHYVGLSQEKRDHFNIWTKAEVYSYSVITYITCKYFTDFLLKIPTRVNYELHSTGSVHVLRLTPRSKPTQLRPMSLNRHQIGIYALRLVECVADNNKRVS
jgi:hypothetical protein